MTVLQLTQEEFDILMEMGSILMRHSKTIIEDQIAKMESHPLITIMRELGEKSIEERSRVEGLISNMMEKNVGEIKRRLDLMQSITAKITLAKETLIIKPIDPVNEVNNIVNKQNS